MATLLLQKAPRELSAGRRTARERRDTSTCPSRLDPQTVSGRATCAWSLGSLPGDGRPSKEVPWGAVTLTGPVASVSACPPLDRERDPPGPASATCPCVGTRRRVRWWDAWPPPGHLWVWREAGWVSLGRVGELKPLSRVAGPPLPLPSPRPLLPPSDTSASRTQPLRPANLGGAEP